jgi:adenosylcobyric acid synthase
MNMKKTTNHGGDLTSLSETYALPKEAILDCSANINPLGMPEWVRRKLNRVMEDLVHYPDPQCRELRAALAEAVSEELAGTLEMEAVLPGNGSEEVMFALARVAADRGMPRAIIPVPSYSDYVTASNQAGLSVNALSLKESAGFRLEGSKEDLEKAFEEASAEGGALVFLAKPNNPTGLIPPNDLLLSFIQEYPRCLFALDEAFIDFCENEKSLLFDVIGGGSAKGMKDMPENLLVLRSCTKFFAIPGLRLGFALGREELLDEMRSYIPEWSVNHFAQEVGKDLYQDKEYREESRRSCREYRRDLAEGLSSIPSIRRDGKIYPGQANYLFLRLPKGAPDSRVLTDTMAKRGIAIRDCSTYDGLSVPNRFIRVAVRTPEENERLVRVLRESLEGSAGSRAEESRAKGARTRSGKRRAKTIMFQGTSSNAGKSVLTAALCRVLLEDGYRVAPFKAQNMALNSFVTRDGGEMGRAQVTQAAACRIEPDVRMNPVLLKPSSDTGSQVIVNGKPQGTMQAREYYQQKKNLVPVVHRAFDELASEYDVIVLEGAGSPGEINLRPHDIVNMKMARYAAAPVLLVGDIDRGGVFASLVGTMDVLLEWERRLVAGFILNRFRGDASLLAPANDYVAEYTGRRVLGTVPYLEDLNIPEEDSVTFKESLGSRAKDRTDGRAGSGEAGITIALVDLPHISNFTDFDALRSEKDVELKVISRLEELRGVRESGLDAVILPGSKNVASDLEHLKARGIAEEVITLAGEGDCTVIGVCGGYQMLGWEILDPQGIETAMKKVRGLGLLPIRTELKGDKILSQARGVHLPSGERVIGYEIHHGETRLINNADLGEAAGETATSVAAVIKTEKDESIGYAAKDHSVWGTYLHGIFDAPGFRRWFINGLRKRKGLEILPQEGNSPGNGDVDFVLETAFNRIARIFRETTDLEEIYKVMG